jgi:hypothetical protein
MDQEFADIARLAAEKLAGNDPNLIELVEAKLAGRQTPHSVYDVATIISISTAIVNVLKFLWDVSKDIRDIRAKKREELKSRILAEADWPSGMSSQDREKVAEAALNAIKAG